MKTKWPRPREFDVEWALDAAMDAFFGHTFALTSSGVAVEIQLVLDASLMAMTPTILAPAIRFSLFVLGEVPKTHRP